MDILQLLLDGVFLVLLVGGAFAWFVGERQGVRRASSVAAVLGLIGLLAALSAVIVPAGHVAVVAEFGRVQADELQPGLHFRLPFVNSVTLVDTRVQGIHFENLGAASREYQDVILSGTLNVHVDPNRASDIVQNVGLDYSAKIVVPFYANLVKEVVPQYAIGDVLPHREDIRKQTVVKLASKLIVYGVIVDDVAIENISFSEAYTKAIEAKQVAQQQVQTEQQVLEQRRLQAQQAVVAAEGQAKANQLLAESLTPTLVQYTLIQKLAPTITTILLPADQQFILSPELLTPKAPTP